MKDVKFLDIILDEGLTWEKHIKLITNKLRRTLYKFLQLRKCATLEIQKMVYYSLTQSILAYGIGAWGGAYQNKIEQLNVIQRKTLKIIHKKK